MQRDIAATKLPLAAPVGLDSPIHEEAFANLRQTLRYGAEANLPFAQRKILEALRTLEKGETLNSRLAFIEARQLLSEIDPRSLVNPQSPGIDGSTRSWQEWASTCTLSQCSSWVYRTLNQIAKKQLKDELEPHGEFNAKAMQGIAVVAKMLTDREALTQQEQFSYRDQIGVALQQLGLDF